MDEGISVLIAAGFAILGIFYASRQQRKMLRKQHTYQVIDKINDWKEFDQNLDFASKLIKAGKIPKLCDDKNKESCDKIDFLLNYYEFLSAAIISGDVDEGLVKRVERTRLCRIYLKFIDYVEENREERGTIVLWENLEFMCYRWALPRYDPLESMITGFLLHPLTNYFDAHRDIVSSQLRAHAEKIR